MNVRPALPPSLIGGMVDVQVTPALAMRDTMTHMKSPAQTLAFGMAASMAGFLLACGDKNRRMALPHTRIMLHQPYGAARGQVRSKLATHSSFFSSSSFLLLVPVPWLTL